MAVTGRWLRRGRLSWRKPDSRLADGLGVELTHTSHVHFEDNDTEKVAVLTRLTLPHGGRVGRLDPGGFGKRIRGTITA